MSVLHLGSSQPTYRLTLTPQPYSSVAHHGVPCCSVWHTIVCHGVPHCSVWHTSMVLPTSQADTRARPHQEGNSPLPQAKNPDPDLALHLPTFVTRVTCLSPVTIFFRNICHALEILKADIQLSGSRAVRASWGSRRRSDDCKFSQFFPSEGPALLRVVS